MLCQKGVAVSCYLTNLSRRYTVKIPQVGHHFYANQVHVKLSSFNAALYCARQMYCLDTSLWPIEVSCRIECCYARNKQDKRYACLAGCT